MRVPANARGPDIVLTSMRIVPITSSSSERATDRAAVDTIAGLALRAAGGDGEAFDALVAARLDRTFRTARAILGNDTDARDATQEAWLSAWRRLPTLRDPVAFDGWLDRIVVNACRDALRRRGAVREIPMADAFDVVSPGAAPDQLAERDALERAFDRLDADKRAVLVLHHLHHLPVASIATALGIPEGTVKWRLHAARNALARAMERDR
jgi:RNA polymerase sigma-70 factor (ECF subfamily)